MIARTLRKQTQGSVLLMAMVTIVIAFSIAGYMMVAAVQAHRATTDKIAYENAYQSAEGGAEQCFDWLDKTQDPDATLPTHDPTGGWEHIRNIVEVAVAMNTILDEDPSATPNYTDFDGSNGSINLNLSGATDDDGNVILATFFDRTSDSSAWGDFCKMYAGTSDNEVGEVTRMRLIAANTTDFNFWIESTGKGEFRGREKSRTIRYAIRVSGTSNPLVTLPAALVSGNGASGNGQFNMFWGEGWAKGNVRMPWGFTNKIQWSNIIPKPPTGMNNFSPNNFPGPDTDPNRWAQFKVTGNLLDQNGTALREFWNKDNNIGHLGNPQDFVSGVPGGEASDWSDRLFQQEDRTLVGDRMTLATDPDTGEAPVSLAGQIDDVMAGFEYDYWKDLAQSHGTYVRSTGAAGADGPYEDQAGRTYYVDNNYNITTVNTGTKAKLSDFSQYISQRDGSFADANVPASIFFVDTTDGTAPKSDESNWVDLGNINPAVYFKGVMYVAGSLSFAGGGNPPTVTMEAPDGTTLDSKVWMNGVAYARGSYKNQGGSVVYGSIVTQKGGYDTGGNPGVYYNQKLADGTAFPFSLQANFALGTVHEIPNPAS